MAVGTKASIFRSAGELDVESQSSDPLMPIDRDNFDKAWLKRRARNAAYTKFTHRPLLEHPAARSKVVPALRDAIVHHHTSKPQDALSRMGFDRALSFLKARLPASHHTRMGNFGEIVCLEHLRQRHGYRFPVLRLRYQEHQELPMRGEDVLGFVLDASQAKIRRLVISEAKTMQSFDSREVDDAHKRLEQAHRPHPASLAMIAEVLRLQEDDLAEEVEILIEAFAGSDIDTDHWIFVIYGNKPRSPFKTIEAKSAVLPDLSCVDLQLTQVAELVNSIFDKPL